MYQSPIHTNPPANTSLILFHLLQHCPATLIQDQTNPEFALWLSKITEAINKENLLALNDKGDIALTFAIKLYADDEKIISFLISFYVANDILISALSEHAYKISCFYVLAKGGENLFHPLLLAQEEKESKKFIEVFFEGNFKELINYLPALLAIAKKSGFSYLDSFIKALRNSPNIYKNDTLLEKIFDHVKHHAQSCLHADTFIKQLNDAELLLDDQTVLDELFTYLSQAHFYKASRCIGAFNSPIFLSDAEQRNRKYKELELRKDHDADYFCDQIKQSQSFLNHSQLTKLITRIPLSSISDLIIKIRDDYEWMWYKHQIIIPFIYATITAWGDNRFPTSLKTNGVSSHVNTTYNTKTNEAESTLTRLSTGFFNIFSSKSPRTNQQESPRKDSYNTAQAISNPSLIIPTDDEEIIPFQSYETKCMNLVNGIFTLVYSSFKIPSRFVTQILFFMRFIKNLEGIENFIAVTNRLFHYFSRTEILIYKVFKRLNDGIIADLHAQQISQEKTSPLKAAINFINNVCLTLNNEKSVVLFTSPLLAILEELMKADGNRDGVYGFNSGSLIADILYKNNAYQKLLLEDREFVIFICNKLKDTPLSSLYNQIPELHQSYLNSLRAEIMMKYQ